MKNNKYDAKGHVIEPKLSLDEYCRRKYVKVRNAFLNNLIYIVPTYIALALFCLIAEQIFVHGDKLQNADDMLDYIVSWKLFVFSMLVGYFIKITRQFRNGEI